MSALLITGAALAGVLVFLLATATGNTAAFARHYPLLLALNAGLAVVLLGIVGWQLATLVRRYRARTFGSRLTLRMLLLLAGMALAPGLLVYTVSVQFLTKSIESWFDLRVDAALEGGLSLGQQAIDQMLEELTAKARSMAFDLADRTPAQQSGALARLREQANVQEAVIVTASGRVLATATADMSRLVPELPSAQMLRQTRANRSYAAVDAAGGALALRAVVPIAVAALADEARFLQLRNEVPAAIARSAEAVENVYRDYRELALARQGLKRIYVVTLTLVLLMALFLAFALAFVLSRRLAEPLAALARATQAVARGDFSQRPPVTSRDEIGVLTESFNSMTGQLDEARAAAEGNRIALEGAKARLEDILGHLSAGVLVFDAELRLGTCNAGAEAQLGAGLAAQIGRTLEDWCALAAFAGPVREAFLAHRERAWQIELALAGGKTLLARGAALPASSGGGYVLVFDDVTQLIQAQRLNAWAEVARRLAHEIKNPLTPIQLAAERAERKLAGKLAPGDAEALARSTRTIVEQVGALKAMVDDFRDYARLPAPVFTEVDLNTLVADTLAMYEGAQVPVRRRLAPALPPARADAAQLRQVLHNLVQNAQDALLATARADAAIEVRTERAGERLRLVVADNGGGFPEAMMARVFEPYVTSKPRGTGLGLPIVKKIVDEHRGEIEIENRPGVGATVSVSLPLAGAAQAA